MFIDPTVEKTAEYSVTEMRVIVDKKTPRDATICFMFSLPGMMEVHDEALAIEIDTGSASLVMRLFHDAERVFYRIGFGEEELVFVARKSPGPVDFPPEEDVDEE